jgi:VIT1/CCC1 family predicted Fe2+/Mn2+ transporter
MSVGPRRHVRADIGIAIDDGKKRDSLGRICLAGSSTFERLKKSLAASAGDIVFGMEDGTVSIFGLVLGVAATTNDNATVLIAGASGACAAAVSMMAGTYLEAETNLDEARSFSARLAAEIGQNPQAVVDRAAARLEAAGLKGAESAPVIDLIRAKPTLLKGLASAIMAPAAQTVGSPLAHSLWMLVADFISAAIPIVPFALMPVPEARYVSTAITMALLIALGVGRARVGARPLARTVAQTVAIGVAAALAGVGIGLIIAHAL